MIRNPEKWREWEEQGPLSEPADFEKNRKIFDEVVRQAIAMGVFPPKDPLEGIEDKIRLARAINGRRTTDEDLAHATKLLGRAWPPREK